VLRLWRAFGYSLEGLRCALGQSAFRLELVLGAILVPLACWLQVGRVERLWLIGSVLLVIIVELLNSAVEAAIDRISAERHPLSKQAKDLGSAAVLVAVVHALIAWGVVLWPG
jgi:diacylglycerol kinase (ATP)